MYTIYHVVVAPGRGVIQFVYRNVKTSPRIIILISQISERGCVAILDFPPRAHIGREGYYSYVWGYYSYLLAIVLCIGN